MEFKHSFVTEPTGQDGSARSKIEHLRLDSISAVSETESEGNRSTCLETPDNRLLYRHYIERALKNKGLRKMLR